MTQENVETNLEDVLAAIADSSAIVENRLISIETDLKEIKTDWTSVRATMVTKEYLDEKFKDKRGDVVGVVKEEDQKLTTLVETLHNKQVLSEEDRKKILSMNPFPQLFV